MKPTFVFLGLALLILLGLGTGCGDTGCSAPSFDFASAAQAARGWVQTCLNGQSADARQYWTRIAEEASDQPCGLLGSLTKESGIQILSVDEPINFLCMRQVYVSIQKKDGSKGLLVFFVESAVPSNNNVALMGVMYGAACPTANIQQQENRDNFESCFWSPSPQAQ